MITETLARSLTTDELALRLADEHDDFVVRWFAQSVIDGEAHKESEAEENLQNVQNELDEAQADIERLELENSDLLDEIADLKKEVEKLEEELRLANDD